MNPTTDNPRYGRLSDAVACGQFVLAGIAALVCLANLIDLGAGQLLHGASLPNLVGLVVSVGSEEQVVRSDTRGRVAVVTDHEAIRISSAAQFPRETVRVLSSALRVHDAVPGLGGGSMPQPASVSLRHLRPEAFVVRLAREVRGVARVRAERGGTVPKLVRLAGNDNAALNTRHVNAALSGHRTLSQAGSQYNTVGVYALGAEVH